MNDDFSWIPGTVALAIGLLGGLLLAFRLKRPAAAETADLARDLELEIADLEARRDELYARLRGEGEEEVDDRERELLETSAARTLRDLDRARGALAKADPKAARRQAKATAAAATAAPAAPVPAAAPANPLVWFALGVGLTAMVSFLVYLALRDAQPDPMAASASPAAAVPEGHPGNVEGLPPEVQAPAQALQAEIQRNPGNVDARKQLAVLLASHEQFFPAFQQAEEILKLRPDDPDALYISSLVRLTMGQADTSLELIDRVLAQYPDHVLGHVVRGMALIRLGDRAGGLAAWRQGIAASGGHNEDIEGLIADEFGPEAAAGGAPRAAPPPAVAPPAAPPPPAAPGTSAAGPRVYRVYAELVPGAEVAPGAALFVSVHGAGGGPPAAVKRVVSPAFPVEVTLTAGDSMMGIELPDRATVVLRLDHDGDPGTEGPEDLHAQGEAVAGEVAKFVLW